MRRRLPLIVLVLMVLLGVVWWMFLISPRNDELARLETDLETAVEEEVRLRAQVRSLEEVRDKEPEYLAAIEILRLRIPDQPLLDEVIEDVAGLAVDSGVILEAMTNLVPAPSPTVTGLREFQVTLRVEAEFFPLLGFLFGLNDMERLVRVDSIAISSAQAEGPITRTILRVTLQLRVFTLADLLPEVIEPLPPIDDLDEDAVPEDEDDANGADDASAAPAEQAP